MHLHHHAVIVIAVFSITTILSTSHAFADDGITAWKITIKTSPGINKTSFWPPELHAMQNDTVQWTNNDTTSHTVTSGVLDHPTYAGQIFDSGIIKPGDTYQLKITDKMWSGYYYFCRIHPWMTGKIDVGIAYLGESPDFNIETNKKAYSEGDNIEISGIANNTNQITPVTIQIFDSNRSLVYLDKTDLLSDHSFFDEIKASNSIFKAAGEYKIKSMFGFPSTITDVNISFNESKPVTSMSNTDHVPSWLKNDAKWWHDNEISDADFINGIQFLFKNGYLHPLESHPSKINQNIIPIWIRNSISAWAGSTSSDAKFYSDMTYLANHGIIKP